MLAEIWVEFSDTKTRDLLVLGLSMLLEAKYKLLPFHIVECNIDVLGFPSHDLVEDRTTLSRTQPPATRSMVSVSLSS